MANFLIIFQKNKQYFHTLYFLGHRSNFGVDYFLA